MNTNNFKDIYFDYVYNQGEEALNIYFPMIFFIHSGELMIEYENKKLNIGRGELVFLQCGSKVLIRKMNYGAEPFCDIYIGFSKSVLLELHHTIISKKKYLPERINGNVVRLPFVPCIQSLYISIATYLEWNVKPPECIIELKQQEGIFSLLMVDEKFYNTLFDFITKNKTY